MVDIWDICSNKVEPNNHFAVVIYKYDAALCVINYNSQLFYLVGKDQVKQPKVSDSAQSKLSTQHNICKTGTGTRKCRFLQWWFQVKLRGGN